MNWKCGAFDSGLAIHPDGKVSPCCQFDHRYYKDINELDWKDPWKDLRDGYGCKACRFKGPTYKDTFENYFAESYAVRFLDVRNNNLCNLECVICNPYYSSKWAKRLNQDDVYVSTPIDNVNLSKVTTVYFAGGEPFLNTDHQKILERLNPKLVTRLIYSSNLTYIKGAKEIWPKFNQIFLNASLDGIGEFGEAMRPGLKWDVWYKNFLEIKQIPNVEIAICPTVNLLNIWYLKEIEKFAQEHGVGINYNELENPQKLCLSTLPQELKDRIEYVPDNWRIKKQLEKDTSWMFKETISYVLASDRIRGTNLWKYLPFENYAEKEFFSQ
jgi:hypothetical protein